MTSVRLHHPTFASCNYVVELPWQPSAQVDPCNACSQKDRPLVHQYKALHLRLDENGDVFVADGIFRLLQRVPLMAGFEVVAGRNAPPQFVGAIELPTQRIVNANEEFYVPGRTKYQARDRMQKPFQPIVEKLLEAVDRKATAKTAEKRTIFTLGKRKEV